MLVLPYPPTDNKYYTVARGRKILSAKGRAYQQEVWGLMKKRGVKKMAGPIDVRVKLVMPDRRRRDIANVLKALCDAMQYGGAYEDDSQIDRLLIERDDVSPPGAALVFIEEITVKDITRV